MCFLITNCKPELLSQGCCRPCWGVHLCKDAAGFMWMLIFARMPSLSRLPIVTWAAIFTHMLIQSAIWSDTSYTTAPNLWPSSLPLILLLFLILYLMPFNSYSTQILAKGICYSCSDFFICTVRDIPLLFLADLHTLSHLKILLKTRDL